MVVKAAVETTAEVASRTMKVGSIPGKAAVNDRPNPSSVNPTTRSPARGGCLNPDFAHGPGKNRGRENGRLGAGIASLSWKNLDAVDGQYPACARARWLAAAAIDGRPESDRADDARGNAAAHHCPETEAANNRCNHSPTVDDAARAKHWARADGE